MSELLKRENGSLVYYISPQFLTFSGVRHAFFTRKGGVSSGVFESLNFRFSGGDEQSKVLKNYAIAAAEIGGEPENIVRSTQKHTDVIKMVDAAVPGCSGFNIEEEGPVDALITAKRGIVLTGFFADCQILLIYDHKCRIAAVVHAGWRGVEKEIVRKVVARFVELGSKPSDITVAVGPSICRRCFETDDDVPERLGAVYGDQINEFIYREGDKWHIDLKSITYSTLLQLGVLPYNIDISSLCPCCGDKELFWSHRRDGEARGVNAAMIMMT